jgi:hypothetical protein
MKLRSRALVVTAMGCLASWAYQADAALLVSGPHSAAAGQEITLSIELDAALTGVNIDELNLFLEFDPAVLKTPTAEPGVLIAGSSFTANPGAGTAVASFLATLTDLGPGVLARWTFKLDDGGVRLDATSVRARLETFIIDSQSTATLASNVLTIRIIPEPALYALVLFGLAALVVRRNLSCMSRGGSR